MQHLFTSTCYVKRGTQTNSDGMIGLTWATVATIKCRLDLVFRRPGRDELAYVVEAGRAPDRMGLLFAAKTVDLRAGDRLECVAGGPVTGTFEITMVPDQVPNFSGLSHLECGVREVANAITGVPI